MIVSQESCRTVSFCTRARKWPWIILLNKKCVSDTAKSLFLQHLHCSDLLQEVIVLCNYTMQQVGNLTKRKLIWTAWIRTESLFGSFVKFEMEQNWNNFTQNKLWAELRNVLVWLPCSMRIMASPWPQSISPPKRKAHFCSHQTHSSEYSLTLF